MPHSLRGFGGVKSARACLPVVPEARLRRDGRRNLRARQAGARGLQADGDAQPPSTCALTRSGRRTGARQCVASAGSRPPWSRMYPVAHRCARQAGARRLRADGDARLPSASACAPADRIARRAAVAALRRSRAHRPTHVPDPIFPGRHDRVSTGRRSSPRPSPIPVSVTVQPPASTGCPTVSAIVCGPFTATRARAGLGVDPREEHPQLAVDERRRRAHGTAVPAPDPSAGAAGLPGPAVAAVALEGRARPR